MHCRLSLIVMIAATCLVGVFSAKADGPPFDGATSYRQTEVYVTYGFRGIDYEYGSGYDPNGANEPVQGILRSSVVASSLSFLFIPGGVAVEQIDAIRIPRSPPSSGWYSIRVTALIQGDAFSVGNSALLPGNADGSFVIWTGAQILDGGVRRGWGDSEILCSTELDSPWTIVVNGVMDLLLRLAGLGEVGDFISLMNTLQSAADPVCHSAPGSQFVFEPGGAFLEGGQTYDLEIVTHAFASSLSVAAVWGAHVGASDYMIQVTDVELVPGSPPPGLPVIGELSASPNPVSQGQMLTLQTSDVVDPDGAPIIAVEFYRDIDGDGALNVSIDEFLGSGSQSGSDWSLAEVASWALGIHNILARATSDVSQGEWGPLALLPILVQPPNSPPTLSNPRVIPPSGTEDTQFEFLVDYYDPDGDPPHLDYRIVYVTSDTCCHGGDMEHISGTPSNGTYRFRTQLDVGAYSYSFFFADPSYESDQTPWLSGPDVFGDDIPVTVHVAVNDGPLSTCMEFSAWGWGDRVDFPLDHEPITFLVPSGPETEIWYHGTSCCPSYSCDESQIYINGLPGGTGTCSRWFQLPASAEYVDLYLSYTYHDEITYAICGTVLREDGTSVPGGVDVTLDSLVQHEVQHTTDGTFLFSALGGVSVSVSFSAGGYGFTPGGFTFHEHCDHEPCVSVTAFLWDTLVPTTSLLTVPPVVSEDSSVSFGWTGDDDVTPSQNLLYQYRLDPVDAGWSSWAASTSAQYDLANGAYMFWVRAKDEAGNYTGEETTTIGVPTNYMFVVNATPKVASAVRIARSVWASRVTLEMPPAAGQPGDAFVLLPEHAGLSDPHLVPVTIHAVDSPTPVGANTIVADELGVPGIITETIRGWAVVLPTSIPPGGTAEYDIVWGKIAYFGWQESVTVPRCLPNYQRHGAVQNPPYWHSSIEGAFLDDDLHVWRTAQRKHRLDSTGISAWLMMSVANESGSVLPERFIRFDRGTVWDGAYGDRYKFDSEGVISCGEYIVPMWMEEKETKVGAPGDYDWFTYRRYGIEVYDSSGQVVNAFDGQYIEDTWIDFPRRAIHDRIYITGDTQSPSTSKFWYATYDCTANEVIAQTVCESVPRPKILRAERPYQCGPNVILLWIEDWWTAEQDDRQNIRYQVRSMNDAVVVPPITLNPPLLPDVVEGDDQWWYSSILVDQEGKVWISLEHETEGPSEYFYVIIGVDGQILTPLTSVTEEREFIYCDRDGYVWARQGGNLLILNPDDTEAEPPRPTAFVPTQPLGQIEVARDYYGDSYRLYDRWFPQYVSIDVPPEANSDTMDMFDLNLWNNYLHAANLTLEINGSSVPFPPGQFTGHTTVDTSSVLGVGPNMLVMTQDDFQGGQVLVTFPYIVWPTGSEPPNCAIDARQPTDRECTQTFGWDSIVIYFNGDASGVKASDFTVTVCPDDLAPPIIVNVVPNGNDAMLEFDAFIPTTHWTILTHASGWSTKIGYLPADVTGDGTSGPLDILRLIDCLNGVATCEPWQCDVNRSDECNSADILTVIDLLNGAGCFDPWNGETLPDCP